MLQTLSWTGESLRLLDQTKLPLETVYVEINDEKQMWDAIKRLVVILGAVEIADSKVEPRKFDIGMADRRSRLEDSRLASGNAVSQAAKTSLRGISRHEE